MRKFIGHTQLKINGKTVFSKKNDLTSYVYRCTQEGNFHDIIAPTKHQPLSQFFDGCLLLDRNINAQTAINISLIPSDANITAMAGDDDGTTSGNLKRGSRDLFSDIEGGIERRWMWTSSKGNGDIGCVCLTRGQFGKMYMADIYNDATLTTDNISIFETLSTGGTDGLWYSVLTHETDAQKINAFQSINLIDWEKELGYSITMPAGEHDIIIKSYKLATKYSHLSGNMCSVISSIPVDDVTLTTDITFGSVIQCCFSYVGGHILVINGSESNVLTIFDIDMEDWTMEKSIHNFAGEFCTDGTELYSFNSNGYSSRYDGVNNLGMHVKDCYPMLKYEKTGSTITEWECLAHINGYGADSRLVKLDLVNNKVIGTYPNIVRGEANEYFANHTSIILANGDVIFNSEGNNTAIYYSAAKDEIKAVKRNFSGVIQGFMGAAENGTILIKNGELVGLCTMFPSISTVNNLDSIVRKRVGDQMELIYTITEVEEEEE